MYAALFNRSVMTGMITGKQGLGSATADWQPNVLMWTRVKPGLERQNSTAAEWGEQTRGRTWQLLLERQGKIALPQMWWPDTAR
jgi:hypothetical protein